jgi:NADH:ubiquinone oxidoreductase subunit 5 (subunit L)/multisubunit Na+/H+ antiporter MnhA subunit
MNLSAADALLLVTLLAGPVAAGAVVAGLGTRTAGRLAAVGAIAAVAQLVVALTGTAGSLEPFAADAFSALVLVLVLGMGATVLAFASRSLRHEPYEARFALAGAAVISAAAALAAADDLIVLALAWVATSAATLALVRTGPSATPGRAGIRAARAFAIGDLALLAGVALLVAAAGSTAISDLPSEGAAVAVAGVLIVIAAIARGASAPLHRWLPDTLAAPTPSSALLHAGVVNSGAIVAIKLAPAVAPQAPAALVALVVGGASCALAEAVMLTRPDVKGRLAWSTVAQMSFTLVLCGLGLTAAAALHLVAHGLYKGALFLGSGGTVRTLVRSRTAPPAPNDASRAAALAGWGVALATPTVVIALTGTEVSAGLLVPLGLAAVATGRATTAWLQRAATPAQRIGGLGGGAAMVAAFTLVTIALKAQVEPVVEVADPALPAVALVPVLLALGAVALSRRQAEAGAPWAVATWERVRAAGRPTAPSPALAGRPWGTAALAAAPAGASSPHPSPTTARS